VRIKYGDSEKSGGGESGALPKSFVIDSQGRVAGPGVGARNHVGLNDRRFMNGSKVKANAGSARWNWKRKWNIFEEMEKMTGSFF